MISVGEHIRRILDSVAPLAPVDVSIEAAQGCLLAEDVISPLDLPGFDNSAMDGYAVKVADVAAAQLDSPISLPVTGDVPAGDTARYRLGDGQAIRIMTGAPLPEGAEGIVKVEDTDRGVARVQINAPITAGLHVRRQGGDIQVGDPVLPAGVLIGPAQMALLLAVGRRRVRVQPQPRVAVMSTGDELVHDRMPGFGEVVDSNGPMLAACARAAGATVRRAGPVVDDPREVMSALEELLAGADAIVTSGGVSEGAYDAVKEVLQRLGTVQFDKVAMQPGQPQGFGLLGDPGTPIFTLPGNPVSSYISFELFVRPALRKMAGHPDLHRESERAVAVSGWTSPPAKKQFARGILDTDGEGRRTVELVGSQGSHILGGLAQANCLVIVPEDVTEVRVGDLLRCIPLGRAQP